LRFPEFSGEWEKFRNCTLFKVISEKNKNYEFSTVLSASQNEGMVLRASLGIDIKFEEDSIKTYKIVRNGDYVAHLRSFQGGFAFSDKTGICSPAYTILRPSETISYGFLKPYFMSRKFIDSLRIVTYGIRDGKSISVEEWLKLYTCIPKKNEQQKISKFLKLIDNRIETQKKIIEKYESLIRGLCEKLTRQGTLNKTITECLECHSSTLQESAILDAGSYPVYGAIGICGYTDTPDVSGDGVLIIKDGASVGVTYFADGRYSFIGTLNRLTAKEDINLRYVYYCLKVLNFTPYKTGLAIPHIYFKDYRKHKIWCPSLEQQSSIADALTAIDNKILVEKSLLEQLNFQKRYMLNQLFI
jgi:type I restriction enzyme S subunit